MPASPLTSSSSTGFVAEVLSLVETDLDGRIAATILLDLEDLDAAIEELDEPTSPAKPPPTHTRGRLSDE